MLAGHLTVKEASEKTGYNAEYLRRLVRDGKIEAILIGPVYLVRWESLRRYMTNITANGDARTGPKSK